MQSLRFPECAILHIYPPKPGDSKPFRILQPTGTLACTWENVFGPFYHTVVFKLDKSHPHLLLMDSCFQYLNEWCKNVFAKAQGTPVSLNDLLGRQLAKFDPCFGSLVTFLSDRFPHGDLNLTVLQAPPRPESVQLDPSCVLDFIYLGMATITHCFFPRSWHYPALTHTILGASDSVKIWDWKCHCALFLDTMTYLWGNECHLRRHAEWSPMPWSLKSRMELSAMCTISEPVPFSTPIVTEDDLAPENDPGLLHWQFVLGCPLDIPWKHAPHDGYPFCTTLSAYSATRRNSAYPNPVDHDALWVSVMTFGLLESFTRTRIPEALLLVPGEAEGEVVISGSRILRLLFGWWSRYRSKSTEASRDCRQHGREVAELLTRALHAIDEELDRPHAARRHVPGTPVPERDDPMEVTVAPCTVALVVFSLCGFASAEVPGWENLNGLVRTLLPKGDLVDQSLPYGFPDAVTIWCQQKMQAFGWCPYTVPVGKAPLFFPSRDLSLLSKVVRVPPPSGSTHNEHNNCTPTACIMRTITNSGSLSFRARCSESCTCQLISPPLEDVVRLLAKGEVPAVIYDGTQLHVKTAIELPYVAISHVWSDGMGSVTEEGLPTCIVDRVANLAKRILPESGAFWIDSLCVPSITGIRKQAIRLMAQTYRNATKVLVIDRCIRTRCSVDHKSWFENLFYIASSEWSRRVWTLQEGFLARELWFEFIEGPVDVEGRLRGHEEVHGLNLEFSEEPERTAAGQKFVFDSSIGLCVPEAHIRRCRVPLFEFREAYRGVSESTSPQANIPLGTVVTLLDNRTTSRAEDELIAVSTLLPQQVSLDSLLSVDTKKGDVAAERMKTFLLQLGEVPKEFAIYHGFRLSIPNFTWAPRSLSTAYMMLTVPWGTGECTEEGLLAEYYLARFDTPVAIPRTRADVEVPPVVSVSYLGLTYRLSVSSAMQAYPALSIDGLLFLDGQIPSGSLESIVCAGVKGTGTGGMVGEPTRTKSKPVVVEYGIPCKLIRNIDNAHTKLPDLERVEKSWVLLR
ncbi:hypothetical protein C8Q79DRAFT_20740 [Trametes meyenii]|nr:hypothetical protein C8Q79DRAFT_20740 [Trametes meyenii]